MSGVAVPSPPTPPDDGQIFNLAWSRMTPRTQDKVRAKAAWEHMSLSAVIQCWWKSYWVTAEATLRARQAKGIQTPRGTVK